MKKKQGFTLIELLIVVAIIGLLATLAIVGLTTAQQRARDVKRISDIRTIQSALELYWNDQVKYPILDNFAGPDIDTWSELAKVLDPYFSQMPTDPYHNSSVSALATGYVYTYMANMNTPAAPNQYYISAVVENTAIQALSQDVDGAAVGGTGWRLVTSKDTFLNTASVTLNCDDNITSSQAAYCLFGDATN